MWDLRTTVNISHKQQLCQSHDGDITFAPHCYHSYIIHDCVKNLLSPFCFNCFHNFSKEDRHQGHVHFVINGCNNLYFILLFMSCEQCCQYLVSRDPCGFWHKKLNQNWMNFHRDVENYRTIELLDIFGAHDWWSCRHYLVEFCWWYTKQFDYVCGIRQRLSFFNKWLYRSYILKKLCVYWQVSWRRWWTSCRGRRRSVNS